MNQISKKLFKEKIFTSMVSIKEIDQKEFELCYELDSATICLWTKKQLSLIHI